MTYLSIYPQDYVNVWISDSNHNNYIQYCPEQAPILEQAPTPNLDSSVCLFFEILHVTKVLHSNLKVGQVEETAFILNLEYLLDDYVEVFQVQ